MAERRVEELRELVQQLRGPVYDLTTAEGSAAAEQGDGEGDGGEEVVPAKRWARACSLYDTGCIDLCIFSLCDLSIP